MSRVRGNSQQSTFEVHERKSFCNSFYIKLLVRCWFFSSSTYGFWISFLCVYGWKDSCIMKATSTSIQVYERTVLIAIFSSFFVFFFMNFSFESILHATLWYSVWLVILCFLGSFLVKTYYVFESCLLSKFCSHIIKNSRFNLPSFFVRVVSFLYWED